MCAARCMQARRARCTPLRHCQACHVYSRCGAPGDRGVARLVVGARGVCIVELINADAGHRVPKIALAAAHKALQARCACKARRRDVRQRAAAQAAGEGSPACASMKQAGRQEGWPAPRCHSAPCSHAPLSSQSAGARARRRTCGALRRSAATPSMGSCRQSSGGAGWQWAGSGLSGPRKPPTHGQLRGEREGAAEQGAGGGQGHGLRRAPLLAPAPTQGMRLEAQCSNRDVQRQAACVRLRMCVGGIAAGGAHRFICASSPRMIAACTSARSALQACGAHGTHVRYSPAREDLTETPAAAVSQARLPGWRRGGQAAGGAASRRAGTLGPALALHRARG